MKYKTSDKVRIKSLDWYNENKDSIGCIKCGNMTFVKDMSKYCGQIATINNIVDNVYLLNIDDSPWSWTDEMIEGLVEEGNSMSDIDKLKRISTPAEDLDEEIKRFLESEESTTYENAGSYKVAVKDPVKIARHFAQWQKNQMMKDAEEETKPKDIGEVSDGYHTFNELYEYRMLYNAALFNEFAKQGLYDVHKSRKHSDGEYPFGDSNWFIVMAELPTGQISNHYEMKDWDKFQIPEKLLANKWDEHSPRDVADRLTSFTNPKKEYPKTYAGCCDTLYRNSRHNECYEACLQGHPMQTFARLLICRDAYWKIAGEEMGLGKSWEPDWKNNDYKFIIQTYGNEVGSWSVVETHRIFSFPTEEMRDAFKENFNELIEQCKELL